MGEQDHAAVLKSLRVIRAELNAVKAEREAKMLIAARKQLALRDKRIDELEDRLEVIYNLDPDMREVKS